MSHHSTEAELLLLYWNEECFIGLIIESNVNYVFKTPDRFGFYFALPWSLICSTNTFSKYVSV